MMGKYDRDTIINKLVWVMGIIFLILTFVGSGYVLMHQGEVNAGYAVIPSLFAIICLGYANRRRK